MWLLSVPVEIFYAILNNILYDVGIRNATKMRLVCRAFDIGIERALFDLPTFEIGDDDSPQNLRRDPRMSKAMVTRLILAKMETGTADQRILCRNIKQTADYVQSKGGQSRHEYIRTLAASAAQNMLLWDLVLHLSPSRCNTLSDQSIPYLGDALEHALIAAVGSKDVPLVESLLTERAKPAKRTRLFGKAISLAARVGSAPVITVLLQNIEADANIFSPQLGFIRMSLVEEAVAARQRHIVELLLSSRRVPTKASRHYDHIIVSAALNRNLLVGTLLPHRIPFRNPEAEERFWIDLCRAAAVSSNHGLMQTLFDSKNPHIGNEAFALLLEDASRHGNLQFIKTVLSHRPDHLDSFSGAMYWAARNDQRELIDILLDSGASQSDDALLSALSAATFQSQVGVFMHLAERTDTKLWLRKNGGDAIIEAAKKGTLDSHSLAVLGGPLKDGLPFLSPSSLLFATPKEAEPLNNAVASGDWNSVRETVNKFLETYSRRELSHMSFVVETAAKNMRPGILSYLFSIRVSSAVLLSESAIKRRSTSIFQVYLDYGWDINKTWTQMEPPVLGSLTDSVDLSQWFLDQGADINARCSWDTTPMSRAVAVAPISNIKFLLELSGTVSRGQLLHHTIKCDDDDLTVGVIEMLLQLGLSINSVMFKDDRASWVQSRYQGRGTLLHAAVVTGRREIVSYLLTNGADPGVQDAKGRSVEDIAREERQVEILCLLQEHKARKP